MLKRSSILCFLSFVLESERVCDQTRLPDYLTPSVPVRALLLIERYTIFQDDYEPPITP